MKEKTTEVELTGVEKRAIRSAILKGTDICMNDKDISVLYRKLLPKSN